MGRAAQRNPRTQLALVKSWLLDTGPLVAFLDADDPSHEMVARKLPGFRGEFITTDAVISEAMYFAGGMRRGPEGLVRFVQMTRTRVVDCCQLPQLAAAVVLMRKYAEMGMDFADATLVCLAEKVPCYNVCTLDRRDFSIFRTPSGRRFNLVLDGETT